MKILLINNFYAPVRRGGAERVVEEQVLTFESGGHEVVMVTIQSPKSKVQSLYAGKTKIYRIGYANIYHPLDDNKHNAFMRLIWWFLMVFNAVVAFRVKKIIEREKPDVVWTHNLYGLSFLVPLILRQKSHHNFFFAPRTNGHAPYSFKKIHDVLAFLESKATEVEKGRTSIWWLHTIHDIQLAYPSGVLVKGEESRWINTFFLRRWYERLMRLMWGSPDMVVFPSKWIKGFYKDRGFFRESENMVAANYELENGKFSDISVGRSRKNNFLRLLYVGQIEKHKGILFLIKSLYKLKDKNYKLDIVGSGSALYDAKTLAHGDERIIFHGHVAHENIDRFYKQADAVLVPSLTYENTPTVIYEAFSHGVPVLASNVGGIPEIVKNGKNGWLFEAGDEESFLTIFQLMQEKFYGLDK